MLRSSVSSVLHSQHRCLTPKTLHRVFSIMAAQSNAITWQTKLPISSEVPDLTDKVTLVTGANSSRGMGFHAAYQLAFKNAKVYIGARSASKAESAIQEMKSQNPRIGEEKLVPFVADLSDIRAVRAAARAVLMNESRLDILIHNAAVISSPLTTNKDGISVSFATNHLGPFVLTNELIPLLKQTAGVSQDVRVIVVSAASYKFLPEGIRFDSLASFNAEMEPTIYGGADFTRYSLSKLANLLFARQLQKYFEVTGIDAISISLHPGLIKTDGVINSLPADKQRTLKGRLTPAEGAMTILFAAASPRVLAEQENYRGAYLVPPGLIEKPVGNGQSDELAQELWKTSESVVNDALGR